MNEWELEQILAHRRPSREVSARMFGVADRTLLLGYTLNRNTWHVYLSGDEIHRLVYDEVKGSIISYDHRPIWPVVDLVPDKRAFPERTDDGFAQVLEWNGVEIPFTTFNKEVEKLTQGVAFHALRREEL